jgi:hypothetical protein
LQLHWTHTSHGKATGSSGIDVCLQDRTILVQHRTVPYHAVVSEIERLKTSLDLSNVVAGQNNERRGALRS